MALVPRGFAAYAQAKLSKSSAEKQRYFAYTGTNLMGLHVDDIFTAKNEHDLREKLQKQFIKVTSISEISQSVYQARFESKRDKVVDTARRLALEKEALRQRQLDDGSIDPDEEVEHFIDRLKKFSKRRGE